MTGTAHTASPYLTLREAAAYCRRSVKTLSNARSAGRLKSARPGNRPLYTVAELDRWLRSH